MNKQIEAMKRWVEVFDGNWHDEPVDTEWADRAHQALAEMRQAIAEAEQPAQPKQQAAAIMTCGAVVSNVYEAYEAGKKAQPAREPLTDEQIAKLFSDSLKAGEGHSVTDWARRVEAAHGITKGNT